MLLIIISILHLSLSCLLFLTIAAAPASMLTAPNTALENCRQKCGEITIPYPFGIGKHCSISSWHNIICNTTSDPPKAILAAAPDVEIVHISETQLKIRNSLTAQCFDATGKITSAVNGSISLRRSPFTISGKKNKFIALGCDSIALRGGTGAGEELSSLGGCVAWCSRKEGLLDGSCSGLGCCQTDIPNGWQDFEAQVVILGNQTEVVSFDPCTYAFLAEEGSYSFHAKDLSDKTFLSRALQDVPVVLEWGVDDGANCSQAKGSSTFACQHNTHCLDFEWGPGRYSCQCNQGFEGNPYLSPGCTDIDECAPGSDNPCSETCINTVGSYKCSCPNGGKGDGLKDGTGCSASQLPTKIALGVSIGMLSVILCLSWIYFLMRKRRLMKMREKFFKQNGGFMLKQQISKEHKNSSSSSSSSSTSSTKICSAKELRVATKNYSEERIIGEGGNGTVYKGILPDTKQQVVAIKKSKLIDATQMEQFVNEVIILTQVNHRHVVKLLGCCLETEVPMLVYEFISNGSLYDHIHKTKTRSSSSWLTWANCLRIASEAADALAYLHSAASIPVIHRDIKSANVLVDESYTAKIADFGASRLVPIDQTQVSTLVQGTLGYLDPEYFHTGQLTEKSDVYSFGVVLAELLTREKPISVERSIQQRNLATYFAVAVKESRVLEIIHPQLKDGANQDELILVSLLVKRCLSVMGEDRPSMREVATELEGLRKQIKHPWADRQEDGEAAASLIGQDQEDLYPVPYSATGGMNDRGGSESTGQYSLQITDMSMEMTLLGGS